MRRRCWFPPRGCFETLPNKQISIWTSLSPLDSVPPPQPPQYSHPRIVPVVFYHPTLSFLLPHFYYVLVFPSMTFDPSLIAEIVLSGWMRKSLTAQIIKDNDDHLLLQISTHYSGGLLACCFDCCPSCPNCPSCPYCPWCPCCPCCLFCPSCHCWGSNLIQSNPVTFPLVALTVVRNLAAKLKLTSNFVFPGRPSRTTIHNFLIGKHKNTEIIKNRSS